MMLYLMFIEGLDEGISCIVSCHVTAPVRSFDRGGIHRSKVNEAFDGVEDESIGTRVRGNVITFL